MRSKDEPLSLREILVYPVVISIANYVSLAFLNICLNALLPLFFAMPLEIGGLGFSPATIGYIMGSYGAFMGLFQALYFAKIIRYLGERRLFICGICSFIPLFALLPIINLTAQRSGVSTFVWICISSMLPLLAFMDMSFGQLLLLFVQGSPWADGFFLSLGCIFMYITASAPNKHSLGATNGLSQTTVSIARAIGPAMATSLFSISVEHNLLGGYAVYAILIVLTCFAVLLAMRLPETMWEEADDDDNTS